LYICKNKNIDFFCPIVSDRGKSFDNVETRGNNKRGRQRKKNKKELKRQKEK
jgi:hypothetical protein